MHAWQQSRLAAVLEWLGELSLHMPSEYTAQGHCITLKRNEKKRKQERKRKCTLHYTGPVHYTQHDW